MTDQRWFANEVSRQAANAIRGRRDSLVADLDVLVSTALPDTPAGDVRARLIEQTLEMLAVAVSGSDLARHPAVAELASMQQEGLRRQDLFAAVRLAERSVLHELSVDPDLGATSEHWPAITVAVRRASFDLLGSVFDYSMAAPRVVTDPRTMLVWRSVFEIAVAKELQRGVRYHHPVALMLIEVDNLAEINRQHGYGVGDLLMERLGVLLNRFFRAPDWVARYTADSVAVLLPETHAQGARTLAEGARRAIEERLAFPDKDERLVRVTASAAVVTLGLRGTSHDERATPDAARILAEAEAAVNRARARGGNTIECVEVVRDSMSVEEAAEHLHCAADAVRELIDAGTLPATESGGHTRIDRMAVEAYGKRQRPRQ